MIIQLEKETMKELLSSRLFATYSEQLSQITDYQQLVARRSKIIKAQLAQNQQTVMVSPAENNLFNTKTILAGSVIFNLLMIGGMLIMKSRKNEGLLPSKNGSGKSKSK